MNYIQTDTNGRKYIVNCCERCGKITEGIHTCSPNPVIERLTKIEAAARNLIAQKGRHNTEIAYKKLEEALRDTTT